MLAAFRWILVFFGVATLTACGGEPSEAEIKASVEKQKQQEEMVMKQIAGGTGGDFMKSLTPEIKNITKIGCKKDGDKAYLCDVELTISMMGQTGKDTSRLRFVKTNDGWAMGR